MAELIERRQYSLPIFIEGFDDREFNQNYLVDEIKDIDAVKDFYHKLGIEILEIDHIDPAIGPKRDELLAYYPEGWTEVGVGGPWVDVLNDKQEVVFSMFVKKAPWDYCFFTRPR